MPRPLKYNKRTQNFGISLPTDLIEKITDEAYNARMSVSEYANDVFQNATGSSGILEELMHVKKKLLDAEKELKYLRKNISKKRNEEDKLTNFLESNECKETLNEYKTLIKRKGKGLEKRYRTHYGTELLNKYTKKCILEDNPLSKNEKDKGKYILSEMLEQVEKES